jgi:hypothetical protein
MSRFRVPCWNFSNEIPADARWENFSSKFSQKGKLSIRGICVFHEMEPVPEKIKH